MKNYKIKTKLVAVLTVGALAFGAVGCGSSAQSSKLRSYDVEKYVTLAAYDGMEVAVEGDFEVSEADIKDYINSMLTYFPSYEDTDKEVIEEGDCVNIDYEGKKDGVAFDGGTAQGYVLEIGSHTFIDGFEEGLVGVKVGETVDLDLTFPENYQSEDLAGAAVVFTVKVNKIVKKTEVNFDTLTDEFVKTNLNAESVDKLYEETKTYMEAECEKNRVVAERAAALDELIANSKIEVPDGLLEMKVNQYVQQFTNQNCKEDTTLADYLTSNYNMTEEDFNTTITSEMEQNLDDELVLEALVKAEGASLDEEGFAKYVADAMKSGNYETEEELYKAFDSEYEDGKTYLEHRYLLTEALTDLLEKCNISYTGVSEAE